MPVRIQDAQRLFVVAGQLLFYRSSGSLYRDDGFPGVFFPCDGYATDNLEYGLVKMTCRTNDDDDVGTDEREERSSTSETNKVTSPPTSASPSRADPVIALANMQEEEGTSPTAQDATTSTDDTVPELKPIDTDCKPLSLSAPTTMSTTAPTTSAPTTADANEETGRTAGSPTHLTLDDVSHVPAQTTDPGYFVSAVLNEAKDIFHDDPHLQRIASHFLSRFSIYDQIVLSALLTERSAYSDSAPNSAVVTTIFDIVKRHIAVLDHGIFSLKLRGTDITACAWHRACADTFDSEYPALPTPARVFNQFVDSLNMPDAYRRHATAEQKLAALRRQHMIASCMTRLVYPKFSLEWGARKRAGASNEVFYASGFRATKNYSDPVIHIASVPGITATVLILVHNLLAALGSDYSVFMNTCETCFVRGEVGEKQRKAVYG
eukprot:TRINITY_DN1885_c0_g1_i1.p1 TRINITY_DN1885_c0_g1~~TRINITY_DN1885_c0_g1_i1.p1  ORF type:complete len:491 (-),score=103.03 TRINITY_DN1885_c0_g1_i1:461-1765(-)